MTDMPPRRSAPTAPPTKRRSGCAAGSCPSSLAWYRSGGFTDHDHYLHVYADHDEVARLALAPLDARTHHASRPASVPKVTAVVRALAHADPADEEGLRAEFRRVHLCRRFTRPVDTPG